MGERALSRSRLALMAASILALAVSSPLLWESVRINQGNLAYAFGIGRKDTAPSQQAQMLRRALAVYESLARETPDGQRYRQRIDQVSRALPILDSFREPSEADLLSLAPSLLVDQQLLPGLWLRGVSLVDAELASLNERPVQSVLFLEAPERFSGEVATLDPGWRLYRRGDTVTATGRLVNLVTNPGFERPDSGTGAIVGYSSPSTWGKTAQSLSQQRDMRSGLLSQVACLQGDSRLSTLPLAVAAGRTYLAGAWVRWPPGAKISPYAVEVFSPSFDRMGETHHLRPLGEDQPWVIFGQVFTVSPRVGYLGLFVDAQVAGAGVCLDNLLLSRLPTFAMQ